MAKLNTNLKSQENETKKIINVNSQQIMKIDQLTNHLVVKDSMLSELKEQKEHMFDECKAKVKLLALQ